MTSPSRARVTSSTSTAHRVPRDRRQHLDRAARGDPQGAAGGCGAEGGSMSLDLTAERPGSLTERTPEQLRALEEEEVRLRHEVEQRARAEARRAVIQVNLGRFVLFAGLL